jgi:hypothetical protein
LFALHDLLVDIDHIDHCLVCTVMIVFGCDVNVKNYVLAAAPVAELFCVCLFAAGSMLLLQQIHLNCSALCNCFTHLSKRMVRPMYHHHLCQELLCHC